MTETKFHERHVHFPDPAELIKSEAYINGNGIILYEYANASFKK